MNERIKVIIKSPEEAVGHYLTIPNTLKNLQSIVGGYIQCVPASDDMVIICNEEGRLIGLPNNARICGIDFVGTVVLAGVNGEEFADVPVDIEKFRRLMLEVR